MATLDPTTLSFTPTNMFSLLRTLAMVSPFPAGNASQAQQTGFATDQYLTGSNILAPGGNNINASPVGGFQPKGRYYCAFDMTKTAAGVATPIVTLRIGVTGTVADAAICVFTFAVGTAASDSGTFEIIAQFYSTGIGTSAVVAGLCFLSHNLAATGLSTTGAAGFGQVQTTSSGFNSTTPGLIIGVSFNGGASFAGTNNLVQSNLSQP